MPSKGYSSFTNSTVTLRTDISYTGDGINGVSGGNTYQFTVQSRRIRRNRPREDHTDSGYSDGVGGPVGYHVELVGFFKTGIIPPATAGQEFVYVVIQVVQTLTAVIMVSEFTDEGTIGTALKYTLVGDTVGTFTYA